MKLRRHQQELEEICEEILGGRKLTDIVCAVTPGGGKSLLPQILPPHCVLGRMMDNGCTQAAGKQLLQESLAIQPKKGL